MRLKFLIALIILTILLGVILILAGQNPMIALIGGGITWFMVYFCGLLPKNTKNFLIVTVSKQPHALWVGAEHRRNYRHLK
jgi:hypothetical protein